MKVALVHELLTMKGGAERVLRVMAEMFPDAPIYTLLYDERKLGDWFPRSRVRVSAVQPTMLSQFPLSLVHSIYDHHLYLNEFPTAVEAFDFSAFDLVLSSSSAFVHGIITNSAPRHLCYVQSPARYLWDRTHDVLESVGRGPLGWLRRAYLSTLFHRLRIWDSEAADRPDALIAASAEVQRRIALYWRRESSVIHPPIDDLWLQPHTPSTGAMEHPTYFLIVSTLARYKRIDLAIEACNRSKTHLKIVGEGPDMARLKKIAGPTIEFYGWRSNDELKDLYARATATIFPGHEDFGLVPLESLACGTPVVAFRGGGALETMTHETAEFFDHATPESLMDAVQAASQRHWNRERLRARAAEFSRARFEQNLRRAIAGVMERS